MGRRLSGDRGRGRISPTRSARCSPPAQYPIRELSLDHSIFRMMFNVTKVPQVPSIQFWWQSGGETSEMGSDSARAHIAAITDAHDRIMVLMSHNTDLVRFVGARRRGPAVLLQLFARRLCARVEHRAVCAVTLTMKRRSALLLDRLMFVARGDAPTRRISFAAMAADTTGCRRACPTPASYDGAFMFLPRDVQRGAARSWRPGMEHRLSRRRRQLLHPVFGTDEDARQQAADR